MFLPDPADCGSIACSRVELPPEVMRVPYHALDAAERNVVLLARADASRFGWEGSLPRSRAAAALRRLFVGITGVEAVPSLADARLERLRLFACMTRRGDIRGPALAELLMIDGFSEIALREAARLALS